MSLLSSLAARAGCFALALCAVVALANSAQAQEPAAEPTESEASEDPNLQRAREAFRLGSTLARQGQWQDALAAYERSAELRPHPVTTYNIGYVERALGHLTRSRKFLELALEQGPSAGSEPLPEDLRSVARSYLSEIDRKIVRVSVTLADAKTAISIDGRPLEVLSKGEGPLLTAGTAPPGRPATPPSAVFDLLIDPGRHVFQLFVTGKDQTLVNQSFEPGSNVTLRLAIEHEPERAVLTMPPAKLPPDKPAASPANNRLWMWTAFGVGAAGLAAGSVFGILAIDKEADLDEKCRVKSACPYKGELQQLDDYTMGANIGFGVGVVGLGVGTALWLIEGRTREKPAPASRPVTHVGISREGVVVSGWF